MGKYSQKQIDSIIKLSIAGLTTRQIADRLSIGKSGVNNVIRRFVHTEKEPEQTHTEGAQVLYLDIETAPCIAAVFGRFNINLSQANIIENGGQIISACWAWNDEPEVQGVVMTPNEAVQRDDFNTLAQLYDAISQADILVYQNGDRFDLPKIKTRCILNDLPPPKICKTVDTLKIAKQLGFPSNRLDSLGDYLGVGRKQSHSGISLWIDCLNGVQEALDEMLEYNKQDVLLLREVYKRIRPFDMRHPNMQHYYNDDKKRCTVCGSEHVTPTGNVIHTQLSTFTEVACDDCGHRMRERKNLKSKEKMQNTLMNAQG